MYVTGIWLSGRKPKIFLYHLYILKREEEEEEEEEKGGSIHFSGMKTHCIRECADLRRITLLRRVEILHR